MADKNKAKNRPDTHKKTGHYISWVLLATDFLY